MFGAEKFASTRRTFLPKSFARDEAVSSANVVLPTPPFIDTNARTFVMLSPSLDEDCWIFKGYVRIQFRQIVVFLVCLSIC